MKIFKIFKRLFRFIQINYVLSKNLLFPYIFRTLDSNQTLGLRIRISFEKLGPIFVKFGQLLSTRVDLLPDSVATELARLQDQVPPFCGDKAKKIVESALGDKAEKFFSKFNTTPLASASIAQVHAATLLNGADVVVKVLRPKIKKKITRDIELLEIVVKVITIIVPIAKRFKLCALVDEFKKSIFDELDLMREAANASQLRRNFHNSDLLYVPEIHWPLTRSNILVIERIYGLQVSNITELKKTNTDLKKLAERGVEIFFTQVFRDCFFHADMHPGNVWVDNTDPKNPCYMALDFGIIGTLSPDDQRYLAENFLAFFKRDYRKVAELHVESGWVPSNTRVNELESAIRCVCEPIFEKPLKDISFGKTLLRLFQTASRFNMEIQPQLLLLQKTLISVEGLGRQLYPDLDLWNTAKPFLEQWMKNRMGIKALIKEIRRNGPFWLEKLPEIPAMIYNYLPNSKNSNKHNTDLETIKELIHTKNYYKVLLSFVLGFAAAMISLFIYNNSI